MAAITNIDDFNQRLDIEFSLMPTAIEESEPFSREYHKRRPRHTADDYLN